jgi:carbonic anhydrase
MYKAAIGNTTFCKDLKGKNSHVFFKSLEHGQDPKVFFITCADSRVVPNLFTNTKPGDLFIHRNVGNIIPEYSTQSGESASIEFALNGLNPTDIIVCGHSKCGAMKGLLNPEAIKNMPSVNSWLNHSKEVLDKVATKYPDVSNDQRLQKAVEENVLLQVEHLHTHPAVIKGLADKTIKIHAWVYNIASCEVQAYSKAKNQFLALDQYEDIQALNKAAGTNPVDSSSMGLN